MATQTEQPPIVKVAEDEQLLRRRKRRRRRRRILLVLLLILVGVGIWVKLEIDHIDREAEQFTRIGKAAIALLGEYQSAINQRDVTRALQCFDPEFARDRDGLWVER